MVRFIYFWNSFKFRFMLITTQNDLKSNPNYWQVNFTCKRRPIIIQNNFTAKLLVFRLQHYLHRLVCKNLSSACIRRQCVSLMTCRADFLSSYIWNKYNWNKNLTFLGWKLTVVTAEAFKNSFQKCIVIWVFDKINLISATFQRSLGKGSSCILQRVKNYAVFFAFVSFPQWCFGVDTTSFQKFC